MTIPKTSSEEHLKQNFQLFNWDMESEDVEKIDGIEKRKRVYELDLEPSWISKT